ncbi:Cytoplasmic tRNA 2-thiolation protein 2-A [Portunus trituberculatus]|uniref:Cytoplasmic tRNA 2-thiolation protein 2 n=1 Tax=Portunus trituberculatus TaxID=210409 RepID=A0A5B7D8K1_PORTR|nr:Cytoplasmic tRNA 2-thiolation protein 2-A [Portunus trituberculatus]
MCSVDPDGVIEMTRATGTLDISKGDVMCRKCASAVAEVVLRVRDAYCRDCFLAYFTHKFRSTIGKSKQIHPGDRILVGLSGGASSTALLHLIREGLQESSHKKLRFDPVFLYVDECVLCGSMDEGCDHVHKVVEQVASLGFQCYVAALEQVMALQPVLPVLRTQEWKEMKHTVDENLRKKFCELFTSCKSASAQQDLHDQLLQTVLRQCAHSLGFRKMFLGDNSTTLSVRILSQVALGRGSQLPARVHFKAPSQSVEVYRPMRELLENEILHYLNLQDITVLRPPTFQPKNTSIASCTEEFVRSLQNDFPATIPTIFRTGDKLVSTTTQAEKEHDSSADSLTSDDFCALCGSTLDTEKGEASALHATVVSQKYSSKRPQEINAVPVQECGKVKSDGETSPDPGGGMCGCAKAGGDCSKTNMNVDQKWEMSKTLEQCLCYGCRVTLRDLADTGLLPAKVQATVAEQKQRKIMKEQIQDFLL